MRVLELYSGIGGMHYALKESGLSGDVIAAIDINTIANTVYKHNFPNVQLMNRNIESLSAEEVCDLNIDIILMSPPCQPFTRVGLQKDVLDNRTCSLFHILSLIPKIESLKYILLENVKGFEKSKTRNRMVQCINDAGFTYKELIVSPCQFGIPNTRYRYYLLAKRKELAFCFDDNINKFNIPEPVLRVLSKSEYTILADNICNADCKRDKYCYPIRNILEDRMEAQYLIPSKLLHKRAWLLDIRTSESSGSCCFTKAYGRYVEGAGSVYCPFSEEMVKQAFLEASKYERESLEVLEILKKLKLRYFTPREVCRLMCFPETFTFPENITCKQKYRLLGNSINVYVVGKLIFLLCTERKIT